MIFNNDLELNEVVEEFVELTYEEMITISGGAKNCC